MATERGTQISIRKRKRIPGEKFCGVCGEKAFAHHFGALACESCKAFFRRNALRPNEVKQCCNDGKCHINKECRRICPECRLRKCFELGMKSELIFDEDQKKELKQKVWTTRQKRQQQQTQRNLKSHLHTVFSAVGTTVNEIKTKSSSGLEEVHDESDFHNQQFPGACSMDSSVPAYSTAAVSGQMPPPFTESSAANWCVSSVADTSAAAASCQDGPSVIINIAAVESCQNATSVGTQDSANYLHIGQSIVNPAQTFCDGDVQIPTEFAVDGHEISSREMSRCDTVLSEVCQMPQPALVSQPLCSADPELVEQKKAPTVNLRALTRDQLPSDPQMYRRLTQDERVLLTLLSATYEDTVLASLQVKTTSVQLNAHTYTLNDFLADCDIQVRLAVNFVNRLEDFQKLALDDQIACFKGSIGAVMAVRNAYIFVDERNSWLMVKGEMNLDLCKHLFPSNSYIHWGTEQCRVLKLIAKNDVNIYALLHCVILFDPANENISDRHLVSSMRDKYALLLRHYIEATFSYKYSEDYISALQNKVVEIRDLTKQSKKLADNMKYTGTEDFIPFKLLIELHSKDS